MRGAGTVEVSHIPTDKSPADLFTKVLSRQVFEKHRATVLNYHAVQDEKGSHLESKLPAASGGLNEMSEGLTQPETATDEKKGDAGPRSDDLAVSDDK